MRAPGFTIRAKCARRMGHIYWNDYSRPEDGGEAVGVLALSDS
jgi:hypothetical protein